MTGVKAAIHSYQDCQLKGNQLKKRKYDIKMGHRESKIEQTDRQFRHTVYNHRQKDRSTVNPYSDSHNLFLSIGEQFAFSLICGAACPMKSFPTSFTPIIWLNLQKIS